MSAFRVMTHNLREHYSDGVDRTLESMGLTVLKTPARVPQANTLLRTLDRDDPP
jgi:hypothetical protein